MLANELGISDSVLSRHIKQLVEAGYAKQRKEPFNSTFRTWVRLTRKGRKAFDQHLNELRGLIQDKH